MELLSLSTLSFSLILVATAVITALIVYLWLKQLQVSRKKYEILSEEFHKGKTHLELEIARSSQLERELLERNSEFKNLSEKSSSFESQSIALNEKLDFLESQLEQEKKLNLDQKMLDQQHTKSIIELQSHLATLKATRDNLAEKLENQKKDFDLLKENSLNEFKLAADKILEEKSERFSKQNKDNIQQILKPLGENLLNFKKQVEETYDKESKERFSLESKIKDLVELNNQISKDAKNLTNALKGQSKTQGDWGEMILENILEYSGLTKNREYFVQDTFRDEAGNVKKPDVIVKYPDDRYIIIDSKVSLTAYERMTYTEEQEVLEMELAAHIKSVRNHIDELSAKEYDKFDKTLDFVMLFVPIEPAYMIAMQNDQELWNYAYTKRILLISPTNLIAALKMVSDIWKRDDQNKNAREIAKRGETLYDKFVGFVNDLENIEKHLTKADESWKDAMTKLKSGRGNLIGQAEKLRKLGLKPKKQLPGTLTIGLDEEE